MRGIRWAVQCVVVGALFVSGSGTQSQEASKEQGDLAKALRGEHVALAAGLKAAAAKGTVSATATLKNGQPVAEIVLMKGSEFKTVTEPIS
jgi:FtsP/CotA-like multicopper oxidase with cupredoxin domain